MTSSSIFAAAAAIAFLAGPAHAETLTFDGYFSGSTYTEGDATLSSVAGADVNTYAGYLGFPCCGDNAFTWEMTVASGLFDLISIDALHIDRIDPITFTGLRSGSTVATTTSYYGAGTSLFSGFTGIDTLVISMSNDNWGDPTLDNLSYRTSPVPLPAALPLLLGALGGFAVLRRRAS